MTGSEPQKSNGIDDRFANNYTMYQCHDTQSIFGMMLNSASKHNCSIVQSIKQMRQI